MKLEKRVDEALVGLRMLSGRSSSAPNVRIRTLRQSQLIKIRLRN